MGSVVLFSVASSTLFFPEREGREREGGREREREGSMLRRGFNISLGDSAKKNIYTTRVGLCRGKQY